MAFPENTKNLIETKQNLKIELPHDPSIPLLGLYPKGLKAASFLIKNKIDKD